MQFTRPIGPELSGRNKLSIELVCFDLDGTLLEHTTALLFLARHMGHEQALQELERRFLCHEISNSVVAEQSAIFFAGMDKQIIWKWLENAPWIPGLSATIQTLKDWGYKVIVGTITWKFVAEFLQSRHPLMQSLARRWRKSGAASRVESSDTSMSMTN